LEHSFARAEDQTLIHVFFAANSWTNPRNGIKTLFDHLQNRHGVFRSAHSGVNEIIYRRKILIAFQGFSTLLELMTPVYYSPVALLGDNRDNSGRFRVAAH
jgi:hypothetical protein